MLGAVGVHLKRQGLVQPSDGALALEAATWGGTGPTGKKDGLDFHESQARALSRGEAMEHRQGSNAPGHHDRSFVNSVTWLSTISAIRTSKLVVARQPNSRFALDASATVGPVSVVRKKRASETT